MAEKLAPDMSQIKLQNPSLRMCGKFLGNIVVFELFLSAQANTVCTVPRAIQKALRYICNAIYAKRMHGTQWKLRRNSSRLLGKYKILKLDSFPLSCKLEVLFG